MGIRDPYNRNAPLRHTDPDYNQRVQAMTPHDQRTIARRERTLTSIRNLQQEFQAAGEPDNFFSSLSPIPADLSATIPRLLPLSHIPQSGALPVIPAAAIAVPPSAQAAVSLNPNPLANIGIYQLPVAASQQQNPQQARMAATQPFASAALPTTTRLTQNAVTLRLSEPFDSDNMSEAESPTDLIKLEKYARFLPQIKKLSDLPRLTISVSVSQFPGWRMAVEGILLRDGALMFITDTYKQIQAAQRAYASDKYLAKWVLEHAQRVYGALFTALGDSAEMTEQRMLHDYSTHINATRNPRLLFNTINEMHGMYTRVNRMAFLDELNSFRWDGKEDPRKVIATFSKIVRRLQESGHTVSEDDQAVQLLRAWPKDESTPAGMARRALLAAQPDAPLQAVYTAMQSFWNDKNPHALRATSKSFSAGQSHALLINSGKRKAPTTQSQQPKSSGSGGAGGGRGYSTSFGNYKGRPENFDPNYQQKRLNSGRVSGYHSSSQAADDTDDDSRPMYSFIVIATEYEDSIEDSIETEEVWDDETQCLISQPINYPFDAASFPSQITDVIGTSSGRTNERALVPTGIDYCCDTASSDHVCCNLADMFNTVSIPPKHVMGVSSRAIEVCRTMGSVQLTPWVRLNNVLYIPHCKTNLVSASKILDAGFRLDTKATGIRVLNGKELLLEFERQGSMFIFTKHHKRKFPPYVQFKQGASFEEQAKIDAKKKAGKKAEAEKLKRNAASNNAAPSTPHIIKRKGAASAPQSASKRAATTPSTPRVPQVASSVPSPARKSPQPAWKPGDPPRSS